MMLKTSFLPVVLLAVASVGSSLRVTEPSLTCDTERPSNALLALHRKLSAGENLVRRSDLAGHVEIDTYIHVVSNTNTTSGGWVNDTILHNQMRVLNDGFRRSNISFALKAIDRTVNSAWTDGKDFAMRQTLRRGNYRALNLYYLPGVGYGGQCFFPSMNAYASPYDLWRDGCDILSDVAYANMGPDGAGKTITHEVGHWFGLLHTFQGSLEDDSQDGCGRDAGDFVDDTPAQASASSDCPVGRDSCPDVPGLDPVHNFMDYSSNECRQEFTPGQITRMKQMWTLSRLGKTSRL